MPWAGQISEKLIRNSLNIFCILNPVFGLIFQQSAAVMIQSSEIGNWICFPGIGLGHVLSLNRSEYASNEINLDQISGNRDPNIEMLNKYWMSFPEIRVKLINDFFRLLNQSDHEFKSCWSGFYKDFKWFISETMICYPG